MNGYIVGYIIWRWVFGPLTVIFSSIIAKKTLCSKQSLSNNKSTIHKCKNMASYHL